MFELEFINLINEYKKSTETYEKNKIKTSISNLIKQNQNEYSKFTQLQPLDEKTKQLLNECENINQEKANQEHQNTINAEDDFNIIKNYYYKWLEIYKNNNKEINEQNTIIVKEIIEHYITHRYEILEKIFDLKDDENFESFKWHIKNQLRIYFIEKIEKYLESEYFKELSFFAQRRKNEIREIINELNTYKFIPKKLNEVLE